MSMSPTFAQLRAMTYEEIVERHDAIAETTVVGTNHYLTELNNRVIRQQTGTIVRLTWVIAFLTLVNVVVFVWDVVRNT